MTWTSKGYHSVNTYPRTLSWIAVYVGGLALFLILGSLILVSNPIGSTVRGYFNTIDTSQRLDLSLSLDNTTDFHGVDNVDENGTSETSSQVPTSQAGLSSEGIDKNSASDSSLQVPDTHLKDSGVAYEANETKDQVVVPVSSTGSSTDDNVKEVDEKVSHESDTQVPLSSSRPLNLSDAEKITDSAAPGPVQSSGLTNEDIVESGTSPSNVTDNDRMGDAVGTSGTASSDSSSSNVPSFLVDSHLPSNTSGTESGIPSFLAQLK